MNIRNRFRRPRLPEPTLLRRLLTVSLLLVIPAIVLPVILTADLFSRDLELNAEQQSITAFQTAENRINSVLSSVSSVAYRLYLDDDIYSYLFSPSADAYNEIIARRAVTRTITETFGATPDLGGIVFIRETGSYCGAAQNWRFFGDSQELPAWLWDACSDSPYTVQWLGALPQQFLSANAVSGSEKASDMMIFGVRTSFYTSASHTAGEERVMILFAVTQSALSRCYEQISSPETPVELLGTDGRHLISGTASGFYEVPSYYASIDPDARSTSFRADIDGVAHQIITYRLEPTGWTLVKTIPLSVYTANTRLLTVTALVVGAITLAVLVCLLILWARRFCAPIEEVTQSLSKVQEGDLDLRLPETANTAEVLLLERQFNRMLDSINELLCQRAEDERAKLELEMRSLQTQLTPHFLYNTITSIRFTAQLRGDTVVADMLVTLARLLRPVFSEWTPEWTLSEELAFPENYMALMRLRFGDRIRFLVDSPGELSDCLVPRFTLQPVLENACEHTSFEGRPPLSVRIRIHTDTALGPSPRDAGPALVIDVEDDGDGIPPEKLAALLEKLRSGDTAPQPGPHSGIGLVNVNRRIQLNYGPAYGLCVDSREGEGTHIQLWLGLRRGRA